MKRLLREPLLQFLLLGLALFALHAALARPEVSASAAEIVVSRGRVRSLVEAFDRQWNRSPTPEEVAGLVHDYVREEALVREALALGLDRDDTVVRRRLAQKMEFLGEDVAALVEPSEEELRRFLAARSEHYRSESRFSFRQVFLDRQERGDGLERDAAQLLAALEAPGSTLDTEAMGDSRMLPGVLVDASQSEVEALFGTRFAARLAELQPGRWSWPVGSDYGPHLVFLERRTPGRVPALEEVREAVLRDWSAAKRAELGEAHDRALLERYRVTIEEPPPATVEADRP